MAKPRLVAAAELVMVQAEVPAATMAVLIPQFAGLEVLVLRASSFWSLPQRHQYLVQLSGQAYLVSLWLSAD